MGRTLTTEALRARCRGPVDAVQAISLCNMSLDRLGEHLADCVKLASLYLSGNTLAEVTVLEACRELWRVEASHNRLATLDGIASFGALGRLDLGHNKLGWEEVQRLAPMHVVELTLAGNSALRRAPGGGGGGGAQAARRLSTVEYRQHVLRLLPLVWVLDGEFVTVEERAAARAAGPAPAEAPAEAFKGGMWGSPLEIGACATDFLVTLSRMPHRAEFVDRGRLDYLARYHRASVAHHNSHCRWLLQAAGGGGGGNGGKGGATAVGAEERSSAMAQKPGALLPSPLLRARPLLSLPPRPRLDLAVVLSARLQFPAVPQRVLLEANIKLAEQMWKGLLRLATV